ncbi:unnamed protein product [Xylocopa violacea]|uniref:Uncharacterized protein n=1 Tax=Xylocopa violacea TaxID=135666 RepID=A0ABP1PGC1_XYLVO
MGARYLHRAIRRNESRTFEASSARPMEERTLSSATVSAASRGKEEKAEWKIGERGVERRRRKGPGGVRVGQGSELRVAFSVREAPRATAHLAIDA